MGTSDLSCSSMNARGRQSEEKIVGHIPKITVHRLPKLSTNQIDSCVTRERVNRRVAKDWKYLVNVS